MIGGYMTVTIRLTSEEKNIAEAYAKANNMSLKESMKTVFFDRIENEYDIAVADKALSDYNNNSKTYSLDELEKELG